MAGLGGDGTARRVLERQRDVGLLLAGPQQRGTGQHGDADRDEQPDDDLGGQRSQRGRDRRSECECPCECVTRHRVEACGLARVYWR